MSETPIDSPLVRCIKSSHLESHFIEAIQLIKHGANVNTQDVDGTTILMKAAGTTHVDIVKTLIELGADVNALGHDNYTALHAAALSGCVDIVRLLIDHGNRINPTANVNSKTTSTDTPLHYAVSMLPFNLDIIKLLVAAGSDVNLVDAYGDTPLQSVLKLRLDACDYQYMSKLEREQYFESIFENRVETIKYLLDSGAEYESIIEAKLPEPQMVNQMDDQMTDEYVRAVQVIRSYILPVKGVND